jgi:hypothetical protein
MKHLISARPPFLMLGCLCLAAMGYAIVAAEGSGSKNGPPGTVVVANLEYREGTNSLVTYPVNRRAEPVAFTKEPDFGQRQVERGTLRFGSYTNFVIPYALDQARSRLYLDLNGNLDLTDDPGGMFTYLAHDRYSHLTVSNVHLAFQTPAGTRRFLVDLRLGDYGPGGSEHGLGGSISLRSLWAGKMALRDNEWQVGLVANPGGPPDSPGAGYLLLRPWAARNEPIGPHYTTPDLIPLPRRLYWQNQAWLVNCQLEGQGGVARWKLELEEEPAKVGELKISGALLHRVVLIGEPEVTAVLDAPGPVVRLPVGRYVVSKAWLRKGATQALATPDKSFTVSDQGAATVTLGGPLTNSVTATRRGQSLQLTYHLVGAGGDTYRLIGREAAAPPRVAFYRAGKKLAAGEFVYG